MSKGSLTFKLLVAVAILTLVLLGMIARKQWTLVTGTPVLLETQPIDPRSLFRGDYVRLNYAISTLLADQYPALANVKRGDVVFVTMVPGEPYWRPVAVSSEHPATGVALKGRVEHVGKHWNPETQKVDELTEVRVTYGIESYFVPEGEGRVIERPEADEKVSIEVAIDRFGNAGIRAVLLNGVPHYIEKLF